MCRPVLTCRPYMYMYMDLYRRSDFLVPRGTFYAFGVDATRRPSPDAATSAGAGNHTSWRTVPGVLPAQNYRGPHYYFYPARFGYIESFCVSLRAEARIRPPASDRCFCWGHGSHLRAPHARAAQDVCESECRDRRLAAELRNRWHHPIGELKWNLAKEHPSVERYHRRSKTRKVGRCMASFPSCRRGTPCYRL